MAFITAVLPQSCVHITVRTTRSDRPYCRSNNVYSYLMAREARRYYAEVVAEDPVEPFFFVHCCIAVN